MKNEEKLTLEDILKDSRTIYVFDIDGTLSRFAYGKRNHSICRAEEWVTHSHYSNLYQHIPPIRSMQRFIGMLDKEKVFINSKAESYKETLEKIEFCIKHYNIPVKNMFFALESNKEKLEILNKIKERTGVEEKYIVLIDDNVTVLDYVFENSEYTTVHISYFLD